MPLGKLNGLQQEISEAASWNGRGGHTQDGNQRVAENSGPWQKLCGGGLPGYSAGRSPEAAAGNSRAGQGIALLGGSPGMADPGVGLCARAVAGGEWGAHRSQHSTHWLWSPKQQRSKPVSSSRSAEGKEHKKRAKPWQEVSIIREFPLHGHGEHSPHQKEATAPCPRSSHRKFQAGSCPSPNSWSQGQEWWGKGQQPSQTQNQKWVWDKKPSPRHAGELFGACVYASLCNILSGKICPWYFPSVLSILVSQFL